MARNAFQQAALDLNCAYTGLSEQDYPAVGGGRFIRFLAAGKDADRESDADGVIVCQMHGVGEVKGTNLEDAKTKMLSLISGRSAALRA